MASPSSPFSLPGTLMCQISDTLDFFSYFKKPFLLLLQKPVIKKPSTTVEELENSGLLHWWAQRS